MNVLHLTAILALGLALSGAVGPARADEPGTCHRESFRLILDIGHTSEAPGAISARGATEYEFNQRLAQRIEARLVEAGFANTVLLVTPGQKRDSLVQRVLRANAMPADLLISIHHDSVPQQFKEQWELDGDPYWYSDRFPGHSIFISKENGRPKTSLAFARLLGGALKARGLKFTPHYKEAFMGRYQRTLVDAETGVYRYDRLIVLRATRMPAVLLEAGSIVHRAEEVELAAPERQALIASAVRDAVETFCSARVRNS